MFTRLIDRPLILGTRGMVTSGHYLATAAGQRIALQGGNAVDAAAAVGFCLSVLVPHEHTIGGEVPILVYSARERRAFAISGVGWAPAAFTIDWCRANGVDVIPGDGFLPATVPAVVGTWGLALQRFGTLSLAQVLQPALELAEEGFPMYLGLQRALTAQSGLYRERYPSTAEVYLPGGRVPEIGERLRSPGLAWTFRAMCSAEAAQAGRGRTAAIQAGCDAFYRGEIADRLLNFARNHAVLDATGSAHTALLDAADLVGWQAEIEEPLHLGFHGFEVYKCPPWTQGPVFLQHLALLSGFDLARMGLDSAEYLHTLIETGKLAFADREAYYGDPRFDPLRMDVTLSEPYNAARRALVESRASLEMRPGDAGDGIPEYVGFDVIADNRRGMGLPALANRQLGEKASGDTTHLDVIDREGNMVAATPSGAWLGSSPLIPGLGFPLGTRAQMFYLNPGRPNALAPHKRPRATLTPALATRAGQPSLAFGMRGGDQQDQKTLQFFLAHAVFGLDIQAALDMPSYYLEHFPNSFYPRQGDPGRVIIDSRVGAEVLAELERRGHRLTVVPEMFHNAMAAQFDPDQGVLRGGVCSTGENAYAIGW